MGFLKQEGGIGNDDFFFFNRNLEIRLINKEKTY